MLKNIKIIAQTFAIVTLGVSGSATMAYGLCNMPLPYMCVVVAVWGAYLTSLVYNSVKSTAEAKKPRDWFNI